MTSRCALWMCEKVERLTHVVITRWPAKRIGQMIDIAPYHWRRRLVLEVRRGIVCHSWICTSRFLATDWGALG
jgi:hypothetical protein